MQALTGLPGQQPMLFPPLGRLTGIPPFFPNPDYEPGLAGLTVDDQQHWLSRVRGGPEESTTGFYLTGKTGRRRAAEQLAAWITDPGSNGLAVVTGRPGTGKSALLALPVLLTHRSRRADLLRVADPGSLIRLTADLLDASTSVIAVHARGLNADQAATAIARALGRGSRTAAALLEDLDSAPARGHVIVVDAVDEAVSPATLLVSLLVPLACQPGVRVVVGARPHVVSGIGTADLIIDLDAVAYSDPQALHDYVHRLLIAAEEPGLRTAFTTDVAAPRNRSELADVVAGAIARRATASGTGSESFFIARLLAMAMRSRQEPPDLARDDWQTELPASVSEAFDEDFARLGSMAPRARILLSALAWAKGPGLPWENIWVLAARSLAKAEGMNQPEITDEDVRWVLGKAGAYIVEDIGPGGRSVYRPFHDMLAFHLRGERSLDHDRGDPAVAGVARKRRERTEQGITRALLGTVPADGQRPNWIAAHPYLRTYLAQHAAAAGPATLRALTADADFLAAADPATLSPLLLFTTPRLRGTARIYRYARPQLGDDPEANAAYLQEASRALAGTLGEDTGIRPTYRTHLASVHRDDSLYTLTTKTAEASYSAVQSVAFGTTSEGRLLLAAGLLNGSVCVWDAFTGTPEGENFTVPADDFGASTPVAFGAAPDGRLLLAAGGEDGIVKMWDMATGSLTRQFRISHESGARSIAFGTAQGGRLLLAAGGGNSVRVWDAVTGERLGKLIAVRNSGLEAVAFGSSPDGRLLLAVSSQHESVRLCNPLTGRPVGRESGKIAPASGAIAFGADTDRRLLLAADEHSGWLTIWDVATGREEDGKPFFLDGELYALAFGIRQDGRLLLAGSVGEQGTIQVWDIKTRRQIRELAGHTSWVNSVTFAAGPDGRPLLASGGTDGTVRVWDVIHGTSARKPRTAVNQGSAAPALAFGTSPDGRLLLATGGSDETVRIWDIGTGTPIRDITPGANPVNALAFCTGPDGRLLLATTLRTTSNNTDAVRIWDPITDELVSELYVDQEDELGVVDIGASGGRLLAAYGRFQRTVQVWDPFARKPIGKPLTNFSVRPDYLAFGVSPSGRLVLATSSWEALQVWDVKAGKRVAGPFPGGASSLAVGTSLDGRLLLAADSGLGHTPIIIRDMVTGTFFGEPLEGHTDRVTAMAFGSGQDGQLLLASGSDDRTVRVWDLSAGTCKATLQRRTEAYSIAFAGPLLAIGDLEGMSVIELTGKPGHTRIPTDANS